MSYYSLGYASPYPSMGFPAPVYQNATALQQGLHGYAWPYQSMASPQVTSFHRPDAQTYMPIPLLKDIVQVSNPGVLSASKPSAITMPAKNTEATAAPIATEALEAATTTATGTTMNATKAKPLDLLRESPLRYLGYANELGEAFRGIISNKAVDATHKFELGYVAADTLEKAYRGYVDGDKASATNAFKQGLDALIFQYVASFYVPPKLIEIAKSHIDKSVARTAMSSMAKKWIPTAICLGAMPFISHPIDNAVSSIMDVTLRPLLGIPVSKKHYTADDNIQLPQQQAKQLA